VKDRKIQQTSKLFIELKVRVKNQFLLVATLKQTFALHSVVTAAA
jgi:hypothetical protein